MKNKMFAFMVILTITVSYNCVNLVDYNKIVESELNSGVKKDTLILGYRFGMTDEEVFTQTKKLINDKIVLEDKGSLFFDLNLGKEIVSFELQTFSYNGKLNRFIAKPKYNVGRFESLKKYIKAKYGTHQFIEKEGGKKVYYWVQGNKEILLEKREKFRRISLDFRDLSNKESIENIRKKYNEEKARTNNIKVINSSYDGSVLQVKNHLKNSLKDSKSYESIDWSGVEKVGVNYKVRHKYRAKNSYGGYIIENQVFTINKEGAVITIQDF
jgi:hypothetical protein